MSKPSRIEALEGRVLLAADLVTERLEWMSMTSDVVAGEAVIEVTRPAGVGRLPRGVAFDITDRPMNFTERQDQIGFVQGVFADHFAGDFNGAGVTPDVVRHLGGSGTLLVRAPEVPGRAPLTTPELLAILKDAPGVVTAEPNFVYTKQSVPNDPRFGELWGLNNPTGPDISALDAWGVTVGSPDVITAVIDTGIDYNHPDLRDNMWRNSRETPNGRDDDGNGYVDDIFGIDTFYNDSDPFDGEGHGTHVAGTIAARGNNSTGVTGVTWNTRVMALKFLSDSGSGSTAGAIESINYVTAMRQRGENVIASNNSWGGGSFSTLLQTSIQNHNNAGILFIAAAGNDSGRNNDTNPSYPASYTLDGIVSVASHTRTDTPSGFSNFGRTSVDLYAPGSDILSTTPGNRYASYSGTSMATPHVTGVAALVAGVAPNLPVNLLKSALLDTVTPVNAYGPNSSRPVLTGGRLNAFNAVTSVGEPGVYGSVYDDKAGNAERSAGDTGLPGRIVYADTNNNGRLDAGEPVAATNNNGVFALHGLAGGQHTLRFVPEPGRRPTTGADGRTLSLAEGGYASGVAFADSTTTLLSGVAFDDRNHNGIRDTNEPALPGVLVHLDNDGDGVPGLGTVAGTEAVQRPITDFNTTLGFVDFAGVTGLAADVSVLVNLDHTWTGDLTIFLKAPDGREVQLFNRHGGSGDNLRNTTFSDSAPTAIANGSAPFSGAFRPTQPLAGLDGSPISGRWTLRIVDNAGLDSGVLRNWGVTIEGGGDRRVTTDGQGRYAFTLPAGEQQALRQVLPAGFVTTTPPTLLDFITPPGETLVVDLGRSDQPVTPPAVMTAHLRHDLSPHVVTFTFDRDVPASAATFTATNLSTGEVLPASAFTRTYDDEMFVLAFTAAATLADGHYAFTLGGAGLTTHTVRDFVLRGDVNRDGAVTLADFAIIRSFFGRPADFSQGDLTGDGVVTLADFAIIRSAFGRSVGPVPSLAAGLFDDDA